MIDIAIDNQILFIIAGCFILLLLGIVLFIFLKDRKKDQKEIEELMESLDNRKPKEVKEVEFVEKKSEIEELLEKMQKDLEAKTEDVVETFEKEQEEKSIISYQELLKTLNKETGVTKVELNEVEEALEPVQMTKLEEEPYEEVVEELPKKPSQAMKKFKNTEFISPVYGKMDEHLEYPTVPSFHAKEQVEFDFHDTLQNNIVEDVIEEFERKLESHNIDDYLEDFNFDNNMKIDSLEQTLDMPPISPEVKANEEFLQALKEFRKNLE